MVCDAAAGRYMSVRSGNVRDAHLLGIRAAPQSWGPIGGGAPHIHQVINREDQKQARDPDSAIGPKQTTGISRFSLADPVIRHKRLWAFGPAATAGRERGRAQC